MIVAPILALVAYLGVDALVKEQPHVAVAGHVYPLVAKSNCRFSSGECDLENASFKSRLRIIDNQKVLTLSSSHELQNATIGFIDQNGNEIPPKNMQASDGTYRLWQIKLPANTNNDSVARIALQANSASFFAETSMRFSQYETSFNEDFRKNK